MGDLIRKSFPFLFNEIPSQRRLLFTEKKRYCLLHECKAFCKKKRDILHVAIFFLDNTLNQIRNVYQQTVIQQYIAFGLPDKKK